MKKTIAILLMSSIVMTGLCVALVIGYYAKYSLEKTIETSISELHVNLQPVFAAFDSLVTREEDAIRAKMVADLPIVHRRLVEKHPQLNDVSDYELRQSIDPFGYSEGYLIDRKGVVYATTFAPDRGFNLNQISPEFSQFLSSIYGKGEVLTDRLVLSTKTGILNVYGYYSPPGGTTVTEVSMNVRDYMRQTNGPDYVDFVFVKLFENVMQKNDKVGDVDLFMYNDLAAWSVLNESVALDSEIRTRLRTEPEVRVSLGNKLIVYSRFKPALKKGVFSQDFCTKVVYDMTEANAIVRHLLIYTLMALIVIIPIVYVLVSRALTRRITTPIEAVVATLREIGRGHFQNALAIRGVPEIELIAQAVNVMSQEISKREYELKVANDALEERVAGRTKELDAARQEAEKMARIDMLTGLPNRRSFYESGEKAVKNAKRYGHPLTAILIDLDRFKIINDSYGHAGGDKVLVTMARIIRESSREVDLSGRIGGEEFALILPETARAAAEGFAERLRRSLREAVVPSGDVEITLTGSFGVAELDETCASLEELLIRADEALYRAKRNGRDRVECFGVAKPNEVSS